MNEEVRRAFDRTPHTEGRSPSQRSVQEQSRGIPKAQLVHFGVSQFGLFRRRVGVFSAVWTGLTLDAELKSQLDEATVEYRWGDAVR
jgi:hypothetical protein